MKNNKKKKVSIELDSNRTCATRLFEYQDTRSIENDRVIVTFGNYSMISNESVNELADKLVYLFDQLQVLSDNLEVKGVAKASPEDTFNREIGKTISSMRSELSGINTVRKVMDKLVKSSAKVTEILKAEIEALDVRKTNIKTRITDIASTTDTEDTVA